MNWIQNSNAILRIKDTKIWIVYQIEITIDTKVTKFGDKLYNNYFNTVGCMYILNIVKYFLLKLGMKLFMHTLLISIFSLNNVTVRVTKVINNLLDHLDQETNFYFFEKFDFYSTIIFPKMCPIFVGFWYFHQAFLVSCSTWTKKS